MTLRLLGFFSRAVWRGAEYFLETLNPVKSGHLPPIKAAALLPWQQAPAEPAAAAPPTVMARRAACQPTPQLCL
jgi:hypothetical protein